MSRVLFGFSLLAGCLLSGCGGTGGGAGSGAVDRTFGPVSTRSVGGIGEPVTVSSAYAGVTGVFGANFLNATVNLPPETQLNEESLLGTTLIAYSEIGRPVAQEYSTGSIFSLNPLSPIVSNSCSPSYSGTGDQMVTSEYDSGRMQLFICNSDGTGRTKITNLPLWATEPSWGTTGSKILFDYNNDIWSINKDGTGLLQLTSTPEPERMPRFNASASKIGYLKSIGGSWSFWEMTTAGTGQTSKITSFASFDTWDYDPTGTEMCATLFSGGTWYIVRYTVDTAAGGTLLTTADYIKDITWSPQGSHLAYFRDVPGSPRLEAIRVRDKTVTPLRYLSSLFGFGTPDWGPLLRKRSFISVTGGTFGTNAAGFLYGMGNGGFASFLAFDAVTRTSVDIDMPAPSGFSPAFLFATITAEDSITMLRYTNGFSVPRVTVVDPANPLAAIQGAIVSFDGFTGKVSSVVPFNRSRSGAKPVREESNGKVTFKGEFLGVYDETGKKTVDQAGELVFDGASGKLLSHQ